MHSRECLATGFDQLFFALSDGAGTGKIVTKVNADTFADKVNSEISQPFKTLFKPLFKTLFKAIAEENLVFLSCITIK
jgi:hypothetical protein